MTFTKCHQFDPILKPPHPTSNFGHFGAQNHRFLMWGFVRLTRENQIVFHCFLSFFTGGPDVPGGGSLVKGPFCTAFNAEFAQFTQV